MLPERGFVTLTGSRRDAPALRTGAGNRLAWALDDDHDDDNDNDNDNEGRGSRELRSEALASGRAEDVAQAVPGQHEHGTDKPRGARPKALFAAALCLLGGLFAPVLPALDSDQDQPLFVEADAAEFDEKQSISLYLGNVEVQQGSMRIQADEVLVHHKPNRQPQKIIAIGNPVRYRQLLDNDPDEVRAKALRMEYETDAQEITLIDQAELVQGEDRFASDRIVYNRTTDRLTAGTSARGRERVKIRIEPQDDSGGQDAGDR